MVAPEQSLLQRCGGRFRAWFHRPAPRNQPGGSSAPQDPYQTLLNSLRSAYPEARLSTPGDDKVRVDLPGGDILRFYVKR